MQTVKGLVSISIPFYNSARFLQETIESVLAQTYTAWELLLVDDGSTDMSTRIALNFSSQLPDKIIYLEHSGHRNRGLTCSRNLAATNSRGEYFALLDSDDVWFAHKLQEQVSILNSHPEVGVVFGLSEYWYDWEKGVGKTQTNWVPPLAPGGSIHSPPFLLSRSYPLGAYGSPCPSSLLIRRRAFDQLGAFEESFNPETHQLYEDIAFLAKVYYTVPVYVSGTCWDRYRCSSTSMSHMLEGTDSEESARRFYFNWLRRYLKGQGCTDRDTWDAIRRESWVYWFPLPARVAKLIRRATNKFLVLMRVMFNSGNSGK